LQNSIQPKLTSDKTPNLPVITTPSPSSPSAPHFSQSQATPSTLPSTVHISIVVPTALVVTYILVNMENIYAPLNLPANLGAMPQDYQSKITPFDGTGSYTTQQHTKKMTDYFEIYEVDDNDVRMRIFVESLTGDVRKWFRALPANSINDSQAIYHTFLNIWEKKKYSLQILSKYEGLKRGPQETVQDYCTKFNNVYNVIPQNLRYPPDLALIKFPDAFDSDMAYQLRERAPRDLEEMQSIAVSIETNLISKRARARAERRIPVKEEPSTFEQKLDSIIKGMDRLSDRVETIERKSFWDGQPSNARRNPNFRKNQNPNIGKVGPDQKIRPPFQENFAEASTSDQTPEDTQINLMGLNNEQQIFLTQEDQEAHTLEKFQTQLGESFDVREGYDTTIFEVHKQYNLRSRRIDVPETVKKKDAKQPNRIEINKPPVEVLPGTDPSPSKPIVEDVSDDQPFNRQPSIDVPLKGNVK